MKIRLIVFLACLTLAGCDFLNKPSPTVLEADPGFSCEIPSTFELDKLALNTEEVTTWVDQSGRAKIRIRVHSISQTEQDWFDEKLRAEDMTELSDNFSDPNLSNKKVISETITELDEQSGYRVAFTATYMGETIWRSVTVSLHPFRPRRLTRIEFSAPPGTQDKYTEDFRLLLRSWNWLKPKLR